MQSRDTSALARRNGTNLTPIATYKPLPWHIPVLRDTSKIILCEGPAGGGKSRVLAEKLHAFCKHYPGAMALMVRKTRQSMTNSTVLFMQRTVIGRDPNVIAVPSKTRFEYSNGSILAYGGMADEEQREAIRSIGIEGNVDAIWMEEANKFTEDDYNELLGRLRGTAAPWRQLMASTNPDAPTHWIKRRMMDGLEAVVYHSSAADNPYLPDDYIATLRSMTGLQRQRLYEGLWVQAEGVIYDNWSLDNISPDADYNPAYGPVYWGVDDGYVYGGGPGTLSYHPRVILMAQLTPIGGINVFAEYYRTLEMPEASIVNALALGYPAPEVAFVDSSAAELRARFSAQLIMNAGATHPVGEGIKNLRRFICDGNGQRLFRVHPRCRNLIAELQTYRYADSTAGVVAGEPKPEKLDDHGCFVAGTLITTDRGAIPIEDARPGDRVLTRDGYFPVVAAGMTNAGAELYEVEFSDGRTLRGTGNHPVFVEKYGYTRLDSLRYGDIIRTDIPCSEVLPWQKQIRQSVRKKSSSTGSYSGAIQTQSGWKIGAISNHTRAISSAAWRRFTGKSGRRITGRSLTDGIFTTRTATQAITGSKTSNACRVRGTCQCTALNPIGQSGRGSRWRRLGRWLRNGTEVKRGESGIGSTGAMRGSENSRSNTSAISAGLSTRHLPVMTPFASAPITVSLHGGVHPGLMTNSAFVRNVVRPLPRTATTKRPAVPYPAPQNGVTVIAVRRLNKRGPVFNVTVDAVHEYYANGVLVHNCDSARYLTWGLRHMGANE